MKSTHAVGFLLERLEDRLDLGLAQTVIAEDYGDLLALDVGQLDDLDLLAMFLADVVLGIALGGEVAAQPHGDRAGSHLGQTRQ